MPFLPPAMFPANLLRDPFVFLVVQGIRRALLQHHISSESVFFLSTFFTVRLCIHTVNYLSLPFPITLSCPNSSAPSRLSSNTASPLQSEQTCSIPHPRAPLWLSFTFLPQPILWAKLSTFPFIQLTVIRLQTLFPRHNILHHTFTSLHIWFLLPVLICLLFTLNTLPV